MTDYKAYKIPIQQCCMKSICDVPVEENMAVLQKKRRKETGGTDEV